MSQRLLGMKKLRELLRLKFDGNLSNRQVARSINISASTVSYYVRSFLSSQLSWPVPDDMTDKTLMEHLKPHCQQIKSVPSQKAAIDFVQIHQSLKNHRKLVTRQLLWEEYHARYDQQAYSYTEFCRQYRRYRKTLRPSMRQVHRGGEKCFIDYAGPKVKFIDAATGEQQEAVIFIGVMGASNYTYAEASLTRSLPDWLGAHVRLLAFLGGVPELIIPDNEKSGVKQACYYEPEKNPHYAHFAQHYQTTILPTRPAKPQDKAKVEVAVQVVERYILGRLRHQQFYSLNELNQAIQDSLTVLNQKPFKKLPGNRLEAFERLDKPALKPLPQTPYVFTQIHRALVRLDYHVEVDGHYYSVPHTPLQQAIDYRLTERCVEIYHQGVRVAAYTRSRVKGGQTTLAPHMPKAHLAHQAWTPQVFLHWAEKIGPAMVLVTEKVIKTQTHPECCYRIHAGFKNLCKKYGDIRLEQAGLYALDFNVVNYRFIRSVLENQLETSERGTAQNEAPFRSQNHQNLRGSQYYQQLTLINNPKE